MQKQKLAFINRKKLKEEWLTDMDGNTSYFHAKLQERHSATRIKRIQSNEGEIIESEEGIAQQLYGTANSTISPVKEEVIQRGPVLSQQQVVSLCFEVTDEEIKSALFSISSTKATGSDGFGAGFFKDAWNTVKWDICKVVKDFFRTGKLLKQINHTRVTLIPKSDCPNTASDYQPIACCTTLYNIISKILTARLANVIDSIVSFNQGAIHKREVYNGKHTCLPGFS